MIYESEEGLIQETVPRKTKYFLFASVIILISLVAFLSFHLFIGPSHFNASINKDLGGVLFEVKKGDGEVVVAKQLKAAGIISSSEMFNLVSAILGDTKRIKPGLYLFKSPVGVLVAETRIAKGDYGLPLEKITFPEGFTAKQVTDRLASLLPLFNRDKFWNAASSSEGYLFPETYFFTPGKNEREILSAFILMFREQTKKYIFTSSSTSKEDIVKMASVIEKEVKDPKDMKIVSGIFWKRIKMSMALQADSTLAYERDKTSAELTTADLQKDSPYNSYTNRGLPPTPICNPGINAIDAAVNPQSSDYLYFLTDKDGKVYYAKTYAEHLKNKAKYLK